MGLDIGQRPVGHKAEIGRAGCWMLRLGFEGSAHLMQIDLLLTEEQCRRPTGDGLVAKSEHALIESAGRLQRTNGENEMVDVVYHSISRGGLTQLFAITSRH